jgi:hypothetical protein
VFETEATPQRSIDAPEEVVRRSGDGTVPYQSLRYSRSWASAGCLSQAVELPGAEHRAILADARLHAALSDYLGPTVSVYVLEAAALPAMDASGSSDPYVEVRLAAPAAPAQRARRTRRARCACLPPLTHSLAASLLSAAACSSPPLTPSLTAAGQPADDRRRGTGEPADEDRAPVAAADLEPGAAPQLDAQCALITRRAARRAVRETVYYMRELASAPLGAQAFTFGGRCDLEGAAGLLLEVRDLVTLLSLS